MKNTHIVWRSALIMAMLFFTSQLVAANFGSNEDENWVLIEQHKDVNVYAQEITCGPGSWFVFKFENNSDANVSFDFVLNEKGNPTFGNLKGELTISQNESVEATCEDIGTMALPNNMKSEDALTERLEVKIMFNAKAK